VAGDPLGLTPDPTADDPQSPDYLGRMVPLAFKGQPALPVTGAAAVGSPGGPITPATSLPSSMGGGGGGGGGGSTSFGRLAFDLAKEGIDLTKLLGGADQPATRGGASNISTSDYLRSMDPGNFDFASMFSGGTPLGDAALGQDVLALGDAAPLEALQGLGSAASTGAEVASTAAEAGLGIGGGILMAGVGSATMAALSDMLGWGQQGGIPGKLKETEAIRAMFGQEWPVLQSAGGLWDQWGGLDKLPADQQVAALQQMRASAFEAENAIPSISQFTSTGGGAHGGIPGGFMGTDWGGVPGLDVSGLTAQTPDLYMKSAMLQSASADALAKRGVTVDPLGGYGSDPLTMVDLLQSQAGILQQWTPDPYWNMTPEDRAVMEQNVGVGGQQMSTAAQQYGKTVPLEEPGTGWGTQNYYLTPEETTGLMTPGSSLQTLHDLYARFNPDLAGTPFGQAYAELSPFLTGEPGAAGASGVTPTTVQQATGGGFGSVAQAALTPGASQAMSLGGEGEQHAAEQLALTEASA
jgi:hypothetical protein